MRLPKRRGPLHQAVQQDDGARMPAQCGLPHNGAAEGRQQGHEAGQKAGEVQSVQRRRRRRQLTRTPSSPLAVLLLVSSPGTRALQCPLGTRSREFAASCRHKQPQRPGQWPQ